MKNLRKVRAFTLIELIVVIVIIGILLALAAVGYLSFVENSNKKSSFATAKQAATIIQGASSTAQVKPNATTLIWGLPTGATDNTMAKSLKDDGVVLRAGANTDGVLVVDSNGRGGTTPNFHGNGSGDIVVCAYKGGKVSSVTFSAANAAGSPSSAYYDASSGSGSVDASCPAADVDDTTVTTDEELAGD